MQMINKHINRRVNILKRIQKLSRNERGKISKFLRSKKYEHSTDPKSWKMSFDEISAIRAAIEQNSLKDIKIFMQTKSQKRECKNPAGKYELSEDQEDAIDEVVQGVLKYVHKIVKVDL